MKLRYTPEAIRDIQEIKWYIRSILKNPAAAKRIGRVILDTCAILKQFPQSGESAEEKLGVQTDLRFLICENYLAFYRIEDSGIISVARVIDGRQDYIKILFPNATEY